MHLANDGGCLFFHSWACKRGIELVQNRQILGSSILPGLAAHGGGERSDKFHDRLQCGIPKLDFAFAVFESLPGDDLNGGDKLVSALLAHFLEIPKNRSEPDRNPLVSNTRLASGPEIPVAAWAMVKVRLVSVKNRKSLFSAVLIRAIPTIQTRVFLAKTWRPYYLSN
ncbi:MAG: hypothetical protein WEB53_04690 [Akkermansiaceae bacterium]